MVRLGFVCKGKNMLKLILICVLLLASGHEQGDCNLAIKHYEDLGHQFAKYLLETTDEFSKDPEKRADYNKRVNFYKHEMKIWNKDYCMCKKFIASQKN